MGLLDTSQTDVAACSQLAFYDPNNCSQFLNTALLEEDLQNAYGKTNFDIELINSVKYRFPSPSPGIEATCHGVGSLLFMQIGCTYTPVQLKQRQLQGLFIGCLTVSVALFLTLYTDYIEQIFKNDFTLHDVKTVTAADYTVEMKIGKKFYQKWLDLFEEEKPKDTPNVVYFRDWLKMQIEYRLGRLPV